jgi:hypothetical protein
VFRNIKPLFNFEPPASDEEVRDAAVQFVRKISGTRKPSKANEEAFHHAVEAIYLASRQMLDVMTTSAPPKNRDEELEKRRARHARRFAGDGGASAAK